MPTKGARDARARPRPRPGVQLYLGVGVTVGIQVYSGLLLGFHPGYGG